MADKDGEQFDEAVEERVINEEYDLEEEHTLPLRPGDDPRPGVAQPHCAVAPGCDLVRYLLFGTWNRDKVKFGGVLETEVPDHRVPGGGAEPPEEEAEHPGQREEVRKRPDAQQTQQDLRGRHDPGQAPGGREPPRL